jgi:CBS domain-containing protein
MIMADASASDIRKAILTPSSAYPSPADLAADARLDTAEKLALLALWEADARELAVAEEENMGGGEPSRLDEILTWRTKLGASADETASDHKQSTSAANLGVMRVRHFLCPAPDNIHPDLGAAEARRRLDDQGCSLLIVTDGAEIVGTLSPDDLDAGEQTQPVRTMMTARLVYCFEDDDVASALELMDRQTSDHLLVIEPDGVLAGVVAREDLPAHAGGPSRRAAGEGEREVRSGAVASTLQPGGLQVYPDRPTLKIRLARG